MVCLFEQARFEDLFPGIRAQLRVAEQGFEFRATGGVALDLGFQALDAGFDGLSLLGQVLAGRGALALLFLAIDRRCRRFEAGVVRGGG